MKLTFLIPTQNKQTGWEMYTPGEKADIRDDYASFLLSSGAALEGWEVTMPFEPTPESGLPTIAAHADAGTPSRERERLFGLDGKGLTVAQLRRRAQELGISTSGLRKQGLIDAIQEALEES